MDISLPLYQRLAATPSVTADLSTFGGGPSIHPDGRVPGTAEYPLCVILPPTGDEPDDTKTSPGRRMTVPIDFYVKATGDTDLIDRLAENGRAALHRKPVTVGAWEGIVSEVAGPIETGSDDTLYGRRLVATLTLRAPSH